MHLEMKILILHKMPYGMVEYHRGIDHARHDVTYIGTGAALDNIPSQLPCKRIERPGIAPLYEEVIAAVASLAGSAFDRVISVSEYELIDAARVREHFGIPGPRVDEVALVRDKLAMKHAVAQAGLRVPRFVRLADAMSESSSIAWQGRTVLKPIDGAKSKDVLVFDSPALLCEAVAQRRCGLARVDGDSPDLDGFEVEEFVTGPILHFDGIVQGGELLFVVESRYIGTPLGYGNGEPLASYQCPVTESTAAWVGGAVRAVGITAGTFHLEAIEGAQGLVFLEIANRCGGGEIGASIELATGIHLPAAELQALTTGEVDLGLCAGQMFSYCGWFVFPGHRIDRSDWSLSGEERFRYSPLVASWTQLADGSPMPADVNYYAGKSPLAGLAKASSAPELRDFLQSLLATVRIG